MYIFNIIYLKSECHLTLSFPPPDNSAVQLLVVLQLCDEPGSVRLPLRQLQEEFPQGLQVRPEP